MPRHAAKSRAPPPQTATDLDLNLLSDLLEDTVLLAAEDGASGACESFTDYITAALPPEVLQRLSELSGGIGDDDSGVFAGDSGDGAIWFLQELWKERYSPRDEEETNFGDDAPSHCLVCERCVRLTRHHLFPREMHKFCLKRSIASADELERRVLHCCRLCHNAIHRFFSNEDLALRYNTLELLLSDDKFFRFAKWNSSQSAGRNGKCR